MFNRIRNTIGTLRGFGCCKICEGTWDWNKEYTIPTDEHSLSGVFPTCKRCYNKSRGKEIIIALYKLRINWIECYNKEEELIVANTRIDYAIQWVLKNKGW